MVRIRKIRVGKKIVTGISAGLLTKTFILLKGKRGYIMCGYLDLAVAEKFGDVAGRITGVASIGDALKTSLNGVTGAAREAGLYEGQPVVEALKIIA